MLTMKRKPEKLSLDRLALLVVKAAKYLMKSNAKAPTIKKGT
jgi:hypothetical protein